MAITAERLQVLVEAEVDKAIRDLKKLDTTTDKATGKFDKMGKLLKGGAIVGGLAAVTAAGVALVRVGSDLIASFAEQEQAEARLEQTLLSTGYAAGLTKGELLDMARGLQGITKFGDEAVIAAESVLLTFKNIGEDVFPNALTSILNVSEALGQDLQSSTIQIGKALNDPVEGLTALRRVGITFTAEQENLIKSFADANDVASAQAVILQELESQFGGVAEAAAATATGGFTQLKNVAGDTKELLGGLLSEALRPLADGFKDALLGVNQFIVSQQALKATEEGIASIEQLRIAREEKIEDLQRVRTDLARTELRIQALRAGTAQEGYRNELAQLEAVVGRQRENVAASLEQVQSVDALISKEQEAIDSAQATAAARVAADAEAAASALATAETRQEASNTTTTNEVSNIFEELEARRDAIAEENAIFIAQYNARQAIRDQEAAAEKERLDSLKAAYIEYGGIIADVFGATVEAAVSGEDALSAFAKAALKGIASQLDAVAAEQIALAAAQLAILNFAGATQHGVAAGLAVAGSATARGLAASFQTGTGSNDFIVPQGFESDSYPVRARSGERISVSRPGQGDQPMKINLMLPDGRVLMSWITEQYEAGNGRVPDTAIRSFS